MANAKAIRTSGGDVTIEQRNGKVKITNAYCSTCRQGWIPRFRNHDIICTCGHVIAKKGEVTCALCDAVLPLGGDSPLCDECAVDLSEKESDHRAELSLQYA